MKFFKNFMVSIDFSTHISINSLASGGSAPEPPRNADDHIFLNYWHNFREKFEKILENLGKTGKISIRTIQKLQVAIDYSSQISINSPDSGALPPEPPTNAYF